MYAKYTAKFRSPSASLEHILASLLCHRGVIFPIMNDLKYSHDLKNSTPSLNTVIQTL